MVADEISAQTMQSATNAAPSERVMPMPNVGEVQELEKARR